MMLLKNLTFDLYSGDYVYACISVSEGGSNVLDFEDRESKKGKKI